MKHIEFNKLVENFEGSLAEIEKRKLLEHLSNCTNCTMQAAKLENFFEYISAENKEQVGQNLTARLLNIYKPKRNAFAKESFIKKLLANLIFDDWQTALNERFTFTDTRQLLYKAGEFEIDLRLDFVGENCRISGQIFPDCKGMSAELISKDSSEKTASNENCEFTFPLVKQGVYQLNLKIDDKLIEIREFSLAK